MKKTLAFVFGLVSLFGIVSTTNAATAFSQSVTLNPGWNVVSTPRVLDSHSFSTAETSANFDIYLLDASSTNGWSTMSSVGQTEFTPLYGYFVNNKTGANQTLTFNYKASTTPAERLFSRTFTHTGWYSFGVANPTYAIPFVDSFQGDTDNPSHILSSFAASDYSGVVDFSPNATPSSTVKIADTWDARTPNDINDLKDFRDIKGYAMYVTKSGALMSGFQNATLPQCSDGIDNDGDSQIDYPADADCSSTADDSEYVNTPVTANVVIQNATSVASQNIATNISNQPLGGMDVNFTGEAVQVQSMALTLTASGTGSGITSLIRSVTLVDSNGSVVAGPVDATGSVGSQTVTFSSSITFPTGLRTYTLKGTIPSNYANNATIQASTNPSAWTGAQGQATGASLVISNAPFTMNTMTVRGAALAVNASQSPASQTIVAGGQGILFTNVLLDASQSGEDVRVSTLPIELTVGAGFSASYLSTCQVYNGTTALDTGSNVVNTLASGSNVFTFDNPFIVTKGTVATLGVKCNVSASATANPTATYQFGIGSTAITATGVTSGNTVDVNETTSNSGIMTVAGSASLALTVDYSSPAYFVSAGGTTGVIAGVYRLRASNESVNLTRVGLTLTSGAIADLTQVYIYNQSNQLIGTAVFTSGSTHASSTLSTPLTLTKDTDILITVKADLSSIGIGMPGSLTGDLIRISASAYEGTGASSGALVKGAAIEGPIVAGVRVFKSFPTIALGTLPSNGVGDGRLIRFTVTADSHGPVGLGKLTFGFSSSSVDALSSIKLYGYTTSDYATPISGFSGGILSSGGDVAYGNGGASATTTISSPSIVEVPAGQTYYFELRGVPTIHSGSTTYNINTTLLGDSSFVALDSVANLGSYNFVWSQNATGTSFATYTDWTSGAGLVGLPSNGVSQNRTN